MRISSGQTLKGGIIIKYNYVRLNFTLYVTPDIYAILHNYFDRNFVW